jgi:AmmeMemoRadiSam system protein B
MPSPVPDRPGLLMRDPYHYSDAVLIVPPWLVECLRFFDGECTEGDLREALVRLSGDVRVGDMINGLCQTLSEAGFLHDATFEHLKQQRQASFAAAECRAASLAGSAYPAGAEEAAALIGGYLNGSRAPRSGLLGIAAPHVSLDGGAECYAAAYGALSPELRGRTFVIIGTSHYGEPEQFGLTRKPFATPLGLARTDACLMDELERTGGPAVKMEDYCHSVEHSIEFQVLFLQQLYGPDVSILPVLCGPFLQSMLNGGMPEDNPAVAQFLGALKNLAEREASRLFWVLGIDLAHIGRRYGDAFAAVAGQGVMTSVAGEDDRRLGLATTGDADGFWAAVRENHDPVRWCGAAPLYTFLRAVPKARGELLSYRQWNIDEYSAVSFAAIAFA